MSIINMQTMRYINLLDRTSHVKTSSCFNYSNTVLFAVPKSLISKAIGPSASNVKYLQQKLGKRIKIIAQPADISDIHSFVKSVIEPVRFKSLEIQDNIVTITAGGKQNKAGLLGRNKQRYDELKLIISNVFGKELKII